MVLDSTQGVTSFLLEGAGTAALAWDCAGLSNGFLDPGFNIGGTFDATAYYNRGGGGAVALCGVTSFPKASYNAFLATACR